MTKVALKFKATKFVKIESTKCIANYPDKNVPTLLLYKDGDLRQQMLGLANMGGRLVSSESNMKVVLFDERCRMVVEELQDD